MRTERHLTQRNATEAECAALSEESSGYVNTVDVKLKTTWTEAFGNTAPHQLTSDIEEINGLSVNTLITRLFSELHKALQG